MRHRVSVAAVIWGLLFAFVGTLGVLWSMGTRFEPALLGIIVPSYLIVLGGTGILLSRKN